MMATAVSEPDIYTSQVQHLQCVHELPDPHPHNLGIGCSSWWGKGQLYGFQVVIPEGPSLDAYSFSTYNYFISTDFPVLIYFVFKT